MTADLDDDCTRLRELLDHLRWRAGDPALKDHFLGPYVTLVKALDGVIVNFELDTCGYYCTTRNRVPQ